MASTSCSEDIIASKRKRLEKQLKILDTNILNDDEYIVETVDSKNRKRSYVVENIVMEKLEIDKTYNVETSVVLVEGKLISKITNIELSLTEIHNEVTSLDVIPYDHTDVFATIGIIHFQKCFIFKDDIKLTVIVKFKDQNKDLSSFVYIDVHGLNKHNINVIASLNRIVQSYDDENADLSTNIFMNQLRVNQYILLHSVKLSSKNIDQFNCYSLDAHNEDFKLYLFNTLSDLTINHGFTKLPTFKLSINNHIGRRNTYHHILIEDIPEFAISSSEHLKIVGKDVEKNAYDIVYFNGKKFLHILRNQISAACELEYKTTIIYTLNNKNLAAFVGINSFEDVLVDKNNILNVRAYLQYV